MSFDLYAFPPSGPKTLDEVHHLLDAEELRLQGGDDRADPLPGPYMAEFIGELERQWPGLEEDPGGSPWSGWPLWQPMEGGGTGLSIRWSQAEAMWSAPVGALLLRVRIAETGPVS